MIQTRSNVLYLCEIKFSKDSLSKGIISEVDEKIDRLQAPKGVSYCPVLIHVNGVQENVIECGYFSKIIDFCDVLS